MYNWAFQRVSYSCSVLLVCNLRKYEIFSNGCCAGLAKEFDTPTRLLERPSLFGSLVQEYANRSSGL